MKNNIKNKIKTIAEFFLSIILSSSVLSAASFASEFSVSPMNQRIVLTAGDSYRGTFQVVNPASNTSDFDYKLSIQPFYIDNDHNITYQNNGDFNQITDWIVLDEPTGTIKPNGVKDIHFTIKVPKNAPAGGQYATIIVSSDRKNSAQGGVNIQSNSAIAHIVYAEIAGTTERKGEVDNLKVPSFLLSGYINGTSLIKNTGNVHSDAKYTLQVFPLFSDEELYTNEEKPEEKIILPDRTLMNTSYWYETPKAGIFKVIYTAEFEGVTGRVEKYVIVCPLWLLFIIIFAIILIGFWLFSRNKSRKK